MATWHKTAERQPEYEVFVLAYYSPLHTVGDDLRGGWYEIAALMAPASLPPGADKRWQSQHGAMLSDPMFWHELPAPPHEEEPR